jgi:hypothetical protein
VVALPVINGQLDRLSWDRYSQGYNEARWNGNDEGLVNRGTQVCNVEAYDAVGQPLAGVQLFDQAGRPLAVDCWGQRSTKVPWMLGDVARWNVFPLGERDRPARTERRREDLAGAEFPTPDRATTPEVTNPLVPAEAEAEEVEPDRTPADRTGGKGGQEDGRQQDGGREGTGREDDRRR